MSILPSNCPGCGARLQVIRLDCPGCAMQLEGRFDIHELLHLPGEDLEFIIYFVRASGSLKEMAGRYGQSYPTIRNRLNAIIKKLEAAARDLEGERHRILDAISKGEMSVKEGAKLLREIEK